MSNDEIILKIARHFGLGDYGIRLAQEYLDEYAHNLAEEIRTHSGYDWGCWDSSLIPDRCASLIDPYLTD